MKRHTLVALVQDHPGVLTRAVSVFRRRGYNIMSLHVEPTSRPGFSELTCVVESEKIDDAKRSLSKLIEVIDVRVLVPRDSTPPARPPARRDSQADGET